MIWIYPLRIPVANEGFQLEFPSLKAARFEKLDGGNGTFFFIFTPKIGEMIQFDLRIFSKWVGSTTNQLFICDMR